MAGETHSTSTTGEVAITTRPSSLLPLDSPLSTPHSSLPNKGKVGMICFLTTEVAFFSTLIVTYITFIGQSKSGPTPEEVFSMPLVLVSTFCLLFSSVTAHVAGLALHKGDMQAFRNWWLGTIALGLLFLGGTSLEWHDLIFTHGLTPSRNMFGSTYFTLVGFHAFHVSLGLLMMAMLLGFAFARKGVPENHPLNVELVYWYWHFVDGVWVVVFTMVYLVGR